MDKNEAKTKLRNKILEKNLKRSSNVRRDTMMDRDMKKMGIDKERFQADLEAIKKQGGFSQDQLKQMFTLMQAGGK